MPVTLPAVAGGPEATRRSAKSCFPCSQVDVWAAYPRSTTRDGRPLMNELGRGRINRPKLDHQPEQTRRRHELHVYGDCSYCKRNTWIVPVSDSETYACQQCKIRLPRQ